jgi:hypothetical protein
MTAQMAASPSPPLQKILFSSAAGWTKAAGMKNDAEQSRSGRDRAVGFLRAAADEPLARFLAIGLALFAADRLTTTEVDDPRLIQIDEAAYGEIVDIYAEAHGRAPSPDEMAPLVDRHVMNETLYREAIALGLERGDEMIRERVMQKMRVLIISGAQTAAPDDDTLRAWFEEHRERYSEPALLSVRLARVDGDEAAARDWAQRLNAAEESAAPVPDGPLIYPFANRPRDALAGALGEPFVTTVEALTPGVWTALETPLGWQAAVLDDSAPLRPADFETVRNAVLADWTEDRQRAAARTAVDAMIAGYRVERDLYDPADFAERVAATLDAADAEAAVER